jgi:RNA-binding protein
MSVHQQIISFTRLEVDMTERQQQPKLIGSDRRYLRSIAHHLQPVVYVGKTGVTANVLAEIDRALEQHELIKVRFLDFKEEKQTLSQSIATDTHSEMVGMVGHIAMFYRQNPDPERHHIDIPSWSA